MTGLAANPMNTPPYSPTIPAMAHWIGATHGDSEAIVRDGRRLTFRELDAASRQVAKALLASGLGKGARVAVMLPPSPEYAVFLVAIGRIGAIAAPFSTLYQAPELQWVLKHAEIDHLIVADRFLRHDYLARLEDALPGLAQCGPEPLRLAAAPRLRAIHVLGETARPWAHDATDLFQGSAAIDDALLDGVEDLVAPADPFIIIHTSGSTANPKGVVHGHGPFVRHSWQMGHDYYPFEPGERIVSTRALFWVAGLVATLFYGLHRGTCLITTSDGSPENVLRLLEAAQATALAGDAAWFDVLRDSPEFAAAGLDVVRLNMDMAAIARDGRFLSERVARRYGTPRHHPDARFPRTFGMTETLGGHTAGRWDELLPEDRPSWQGRPVPGVSLKIVDPQTRAPLPPGQVGELLVKGYCLMQGLTGRERDEKFDPEGFYPTGDLCLLDAQGYLKFESRLGEMIKVHGANVAPLEVELAMMGRLGIEKAGVVGLHDPRDATLAAAVVMAPGRQLDEAAVKADLKTRLSSFKIPRLIVALAPDEMPMVGSGKIRKAELKALLESRYPLSAT